MKKQLLLLLFIPFICSAQCWQKISVGIDHTVAIKSDGTLWAWGANFYGQLGVVTPFNNVATPTQIGTDNDWWQIAAGCFNTVALKNNGTLWSWGRNNYGQLGDGTFIDRNNPMQIGTNSDWNLITNSTSGYHYVALKTNGTLWTWGYNNFYQLGDGTTTNRNVLTQIGIATNWSRIFATATTTIAIKTDNTLWAWGSNSFGQLGIGSTTDKSTPYQVGTAADWLNIAGGGTHVIATKISGTLWSWGYNNFYQLGDGTSTNKLIPTQIGTDTNWSIVAAGANHSIAIKQDGTLWSWGNNNHGQLGDGTTVNKNTPIQVASDTNHQEVFANGFRSSSINTNFNLFLWGLNANGQIGDNTLIDKSLPTQIICSPLSSEQFVENTDFTIYPNPVSTVLYIEDNGYNIENIRILNLIGEQMTFSLTVKEQLNVDNLSSGLYILEITSDGKKFYKKFLKQ